MRRGIGSSFAAIYGQVQRSHSRSASPRAATCYMSLDPFFENNEKSRVIGAGSFGIVYYVRQRTSYKHFSAKFLDPNAHEYGSDSKELRNLEALDHDCVIKPVEAFDAYQPHVPAPPRQGHDPSSIDLRTLLQLRAACPQDFPEVHRASICKDIFCGLEFLHDRDILHRDIRPANIFVRFGEKMRSVIGLGAMMAPSSAAGEAHTARVCTDGYAAPELLLARSCPDDEDATRVVYGPPADVWSAGVVLFEIATLEPFLFRGAMGFEGIGQRIGPPPPPEVGVMAVGSDGLNAHLRGNWLPLGLMCLDWLPNNRATAAVLASHGVWDWGAASGAREDRDDLFLVSPPSQTPSASCAAAASAVDIPPAWCSPASSEVDIPPASCAAAASAFDIPPAICSPAYSSDSSSDVDIPPASCTAAASAVDIHPACCSPASIPPASCATAADTVYISVASSPDVPHQATEPPMTRPVELGPEREFVELPPVRSSTTCACSGSCRNPGHRRNRCQAVAMSDSKFCEICMCKWPSCSKPRRWKGYCVGHEKVVNDLGHTWRLVLAASQLNQHLVPCDVPSFIAFYARHRYCLPALVAAAFVEPAAVERLELEARKSNTSLRDAAGFRKCWLKVTRSERRSVELQQLTGRCTGRVFGLGPTLSAVGIIQPSPDAGDADADARGYNVQEDVGKFLDVWKVFAGDSWPTTVETRNFVTFCGQVRNLLQEIAKRFHVFGLAAEGYCFHLLFRKLLIAEASFRHRSTSFASVNWQSLAVGDLKYDRADPLSAFDWYTSAGGLSQLFFGRGDMPLFLSCFACLWDGVVWETGEDAAHLVASDALREFAEAWRRQNGIPPHPSVLVADYRRLSLPSSEAKRKRYTLDVSDTISVTESQP